MNNSQIQPNQKIKHILRFVAITLLVIGIVFRFLNLDGKIYWGDETYTSLRIYGYLEQEAIEEVFDGAVISVEDLQKYQQPSPEKTLKDTIYSLKKEDPHHPPLYYTTLRVWTQVFGHSVATIRSWSAVLSLFAFPAIYWLCLELFESSIVGWVAIALISVSPFHVLYAQEARQYSLWTVTTLLSSAALLHALSNRSTNIRDRILTWGAYSFTLTLGFYTFLLSGLVAIAQGIYVIVRERFRLTQKLREFAIASLLSVVLFIPWILVVLNNSQRFETMTNWTKTPATLFTLVKSWLADLSRVFIDFNFTSADPLVYAIIPLIFGFILALYSTYYLCRHTPSQVWLYPIILLAVTALSLILPDIISGGRRSTIGRYLTPGYLSIQIAVAYTIASQISSHWKNWRTKLWRYGFGVLILAGLASCAVSSQAQVWWKNYTTYNYPQVAQQMEQANQPLLISDTDRANLVALSYLLDPKVRLQLVVKGNIPQVATGFSDVFLYKPSDELLEGLQQQGYNIEVFDRDNDLWKIK